MSEDEEKCYRCTEGENGDDDFPQEGSPRLKGIAVFFPIEM
jgi:hypothetical protein